MSVIPRPVDAQPGGPAPWAALGPAERVLSLATVRERLGGRLPRPLIISGARPSAVLAPLYDEGDGVHVVLTKRAAHLKNHPGQVSFPGGRQEEGESPLAAALREAHEETGLDPATVEIVGELDPHYALVSNSYIVPLVGIVPSRPDLVGHPAEVERVLYVPMGALLADGVYREEHWGASTGRDRSVYFFELPDETVWGATAAMLRGFLSIVLGLES